MKFIFNLLAAGLIAISISGCVIINDQEEVDDNWYQQQESTREYINRLELGDSRQQILNRLGAPNFSEAFTDGNDYYRILYYRTHRAHADNQTTRDETTPLVFKNEQLIGWGSEAVSNLPKQH